jgi:formyl-CoA transferase
MRQVRSRIASLSTAEVVERLAAVDVPCAPVLALDEIHAHEQVVACETVASFDHAVLGPVRQARPAPVVDGVVPSVVPWAPRLDEHADEVLAAAGFDPEEVERLRADGVLGAATRTVAP